MTLLNTGHLGVLSEWHWEPFILIGCGGLLLAYLIATGFRLGIRLMWFCSGLLVLVLALVSVLHTLADTYLFSAHMLQHLLLVQIIPPLLLLGMPPGLLRKMLCWRPLFWVETVLAYPPVAWLVGVCTLWAWHIPFLYNTALQQHDLHIVQHLTFLVAATIFWWPVLTPLPEKRFGHFFTIIYLFTATLASSVLGIFLTFIPGVLYTPYLNPVDSLGWLPVLRDEWGLNPAMDQQLGGLFMWVLGGLGYISGILVVLGRWYNDTLLEAQRQEEKYELEEKEGVTAAAKPSKRAAALAGSGISIMEEL